MQRKRFLCPHAIAALVLAFSASSPILVAQAMHHGGSSIPSSSLTIRTSDGKTVTLSDDELAALPHKSVTVLNAHSKANETYAGVPLSDLLTKVQVPQGEQVKGALFMTVVIAEGTDGYQVLYSLAEIDPAIHTGDVIVADTMNGKKLDKDGAFKLVSTEEKRPARWVRNLKSIEVITVRP
jgi:hypothetical protein